MSYHLLEYFAVFLPLVILVYQLTPQKYRPFALLAANYAFFYRISGKLVVYLLIATVITYYTGLWIEKVSLTTEGGAKAITKKKKQALTVGILIHLGILIVLKYFNFFGEVFADLVGIFHRGWEFTPIKFLVPIGISFYTLQIISYLTDIYRGNQKAEHNLTKVALYLSFFPQIMEGPISRFHQVADDLYSGKGISYRNLTFGYQRILWGLFKKILIADRLYATVKYVFENYQILDGATVAFGVICYTVQLYMEFSGCIDIIIGSGEIFGVTLPENFKQPFKAKTASEFWRRWHITLGTFFKDYIFYTVSLAKPVKNLAKKAKAKFGRSVSKFVAPTIALFCVWSCNGLWHGANWTFIFYGMYYFVLIFIENITEDPVKKFTKKYNIDRERWYYRMLQTVKMFLIINVGELFFRANTLKDGFSMFWKIVTDFNLSEFFLRIVRVKMDVLDLILVAFGVIVVTIVGHLREKNIDIREKISQWNLAVRWTFWYASILVVVIFGAYGVGYSFVEMIYAGY